MAERKKKGRKKPAGEARARQMGRTLALKARERVSEGKRVVGQASLARARDLGASARKAMQPQVLPRPHLSLLRSPLRPTQARPIARRIRVASYNVHRWTGLNGRGKPDLARAGAVIAELDADIIALQEVLLPFDSAQSLEGLCDELGLHLAFAASRIHRRGELGNALLSRFPMTGINVFGLSSSRVERRSALAAQFDLGAVELGVVATHLSLVDRTRWRQVETLLKHSQWNQGPAVLVGDMNAWRRCKASQSLEDTLHRHNNVKWPATYPSTRPLFSLDRIYAWGADISSVEAHDSKRAARASDHLPVIAEVVLREEDRFC